jgi:hypothetical protein
MSESKTARNEARTAARRYSHALANVGHAWTSLHKTESYGAARPESLAEADAVRLREWCGEHYQDPDGSISAMVSGRMAVAVDHAHATANLYVDKDIGVFSVWATGRSCLEMLATVYWLMEPNISSEDRLGRVINDRLISLRGAKRLIEGGTVGSADVVIEPSDRIADVVERSSRMGYMIIKTSKGPQLKPERPSFTNLVDSLAHGGVYSLASGMSHGEVWAITHHQRLVEGFQDPSGQDRQMSQLQVSVIEYQALAALLLASLGTTIDRVANYYGWDNSAFGVAHKRAMADAQR